MHAIRKCVVIAERDAEMRWRFGCSTPVVLLMTAAMVGNALGNDEVGYSFVSCFDGTGPAVTRSTLKTHPTPQQIGDVLFLSTHQQLAYRFGTP
jgi:hypothetical protein